MEVDPEGSPAPKGQMGRVRKARFLGIALVIVFGGTVAAAAAALPDSSIGLLLAYGLLAAIGLLVLARFIPDRWFGGRVGRSRERSR